MWCINDKVIAGVTVCQAHGWKCKVEYRLLMRISGCTAECQRGSSSCKRCRDLVSEFSSSLGMLVDVVKGMAADLVL